MFSEQIKAGAKLLDEKVPGWESKIYLEMLDIGHVCNCIIGQAYECKSGNDYCRRLVGLFPDQDAFQKSYDYGFSDPGDDFNNLTEEWKQFIQDRRTQKVGG